MENQITGKNKYRIKELYYRILHTYAYGDIRLLLILLLVMISILVFSAIAELVAAGSLTGFDIFVLNLFRDGNNPQKAAGPPGLLNVMQDITALGGATVAVLSTVIAAGFLILEKKYRLLVFVILGTLGGGAIELSLKHFFGRQRPAVAYQLISVNSLSFPSGHSTMAAIIYLSIAVLLARSQKNVLTRIYIVSIGFIITFLIGLSRIYLGVHYPSDVIAGWALGLAWASFLWLTSWYLDLKLKSGWNTDPE
ncbi:MAG: phosphatase PAP2 family protein [Bacillota bacterium]